MRALDRVADWPPPAAAGVTDAAGRRSEAGDGTAVFPWASLTKVLVALAVWVAVEEETLALDEPAGPAGATVAHLLAHASGLAPDDDRVLARPGERRIYSNRGFEQLGERLAGASGMPAGAYVRAAVLDPLAMGGTELPAGASPASGARGSLADLLTLGVELLAPTLVSPATVAAATGVAFPGLAGVLPGFGRYDPCDWGLGVEVRGAKQPHWTGTTNSPATFGHFGRAGGFLWVDPTARLACGGLSEAGFGPWAAAAWPALSDAVLAEAAAEWGDTGGVP